MNKDMDVKKDVKNLGDESLESARKERIKHFEQQIDRLRKEDAAKLEKPETNQDIQNKKNMIYAKLSKENKDVKNVKAMCDTGKIDVKGTLYKGTVVKKWRDFCEKIAKFDKFTNDLLRDKKMKKLRQDATK